MKKLKITKDDYYGYCLIPERLDYDDLSIELDDRSYLWIIDTFQQFDQVQQYIKNKLKEDSAGVAGS